MNDLFTAFKQQSIQNIYRQYSQTCSVSDLIQQNKCDDCQELFDDYYSLKKIFEEKQSQISKAQEAYTPISDIQKQLVLSQKLLEQVIIEKNQLVLLKNITDSKILQQLNLLSYQDFQAKIQQEESLLYQIQLLDKSIKSLVSPIINNILIKYYFVQNIHSKLPQIKLLFLTTLQEYPQFFEQNFRLCFTLFLQEDKDLYSQLIKQYYLNIDESSFQQFIFQIIKWDSELFNKDIITEIASTINRNYFKELSLQQIGNNLLQIKIQTQDTTFFKQIVSFILQNFIQKDLAVNFTIENIIVLQSLQLYFTCDFKLFFRQWYIVQYRRQNLLNQTDILIAQDMSRKLQIIDEFSSIGFDLSQLK